MKLVLSPGHFGFGILLISTALMTSGCGQSQNEYFQKDVEATSYESAEAQDLHAERGRNPAYAALATGTLDNRTIESARAPWPFHVLSIGHTSASYQNYGGSPYFHHGLDIRGDAGTPVLSAVGGKVVNVENYMSGSAYWEVAILDDDGFIWQYHHVDRNSIPEAVMTAFKTGGRVNAGDKLGEIYYWQVTTYGERYHHVHLNILGANKTFLNPFLFLEELPDTAAPQILEFGLLQNGKKVAGNEVSGSYALFAKVHDLILHQKFVVPANSLRLSVDGAEPFEIWNFNTGLPGGASENQFVQNYFVPSLTCGNYTCRELYVNLGFTKGGDRSFPASSGAHEATLVATDVFGNESSQNYSWKVR